MVVCAPWRMVNSLATWRSKPLRMVRVAITYGIEPLNWPNAISKHTDVVSDQFVFGWICSSCSADSSSYVGYDML